METCLGPVPELTRFPYGMIRNSDFIPVPGRETSLARQHSVQRDVEASLAPLELQ